MRLSKAQSCQNMNAFEVFVAIWSKFINPEIHNSKFHNTEFKVYPIYSVQAV